MNSTKRQKIRDYRNAKRFHELPDDIKSNVLDRVKPFDYITPTALNEFPPDSIHQILSLADNKMYTGTYTNPKWVAGTNKPADRMLTSKILGNRLNSIYPTEKRHNEMVARNMALNTGLNRMTDTLRYARTTSERATEQMTQEDDFMRNQSIEYHTARYRSRNDPTPEHQINAGRRNFPGEIKENPDVYDLAMYSQEQNIYNHQQDWDYTRPMRVQGLEMDDVYRQKELNAMNSLIDKPITYMEARDAHRFDAVSI